MTIRVQTKHTKVTSAARYLRHVARLTGAERVPSGAYWLRARHRSFLVDGKFVRLISHRGKLTCFSVATEPDMPSAEVVASASLQLKNNPRLFKKWRKQPGAMFKANGKLFRGGGLVGGDDPECWQRRHYSKLYPVAPKEVPMWSWKKPATPQQDTSRPASSAPGNLLANYRPEAGQSAGEEAAKLNSRDAMLPPRASTDRATSWVGSSLHVKGEISGEEDLLVDGSVDGRIELGDRNLTIGTTAKVMADIVGGDVVVYGEVSGMCEPEAGSRSRKKVR